MKRKHLLDAISLLNEWKYSKWGAEDAPLFSARPHSQQLSIKAKEKWLLLVIEKAKELEKEEKNDS